LNRLLISEFCTRKILIYFHEELLGVIKLTASSREAGKIQIRIIP